jgi:predicted MPP superfamily phosphohydrolase
MRTNTFKKIIIFFTCFLFFMAGFVKAQTITRGPYLQTGKQDSITIRWRTSAVSNSKVTWGTSYIVSPGTYANSYTQDVAVPVTEHIVRIGGLLPDTKYWYTIGTTTLVLQQTSTNYFLTLPLDNTTRKLRFVAIGDCGNNSTNQANVKNTFINYIGANDIDAMILLGDNAYNSGTDAEYQTSFFDMYKNDLLKYNKLYPAPGNHDYGNNPANTGKTGGAGGSMPYHTNFTVPMGGEIGGVPSGVKNYYSFNVGGVHFISLDSYGKDNANTTKLYDTAGAQATWLKADLAANTQKWTVAYFHHAPYTKTSHSSDYNVATPELDLVAVREKFIRILERNGVDLILCGHSHGYERSYLLKNYYNTYAAPLDDNDFDVLSHTAMGNRRNAKYNGGNDSTKAYTYNSGKYNHGSIYAVAGSAGQVGGTAAGYPLDCMYYSNSTNGGCLYFEVDDNRLDAKFISYTTAPTPIIRDQFTIFKDVKKKTNHSLATGYSMTFTATWPGTYNWTENGTSLVAETNRSFTATPLSPGNYQYIVSDDYDDLKDTFNVTVANVPLPVLLNSFSATLDNNSVLLDWSTSVEQDNKFFTIERSDDGNNFQLLKNINGSGNSATVKNYHTVDNAPLQGTSYYRLSQTNSNGNKTYFDTKKINYNPVRSFSYLVSNSGAGSISVLISTLKLDNLSLSVTDMLGREVWHKNITAAPGNTKQELKLQKGAYILTVNNTAGERISNKIIVQ